MNRKKVLILTLVVLAVVGAIFYFVFPVYQGIKPVLLPPEKDIAKSAEENLGLELPDGFSIEIFAEGLSGPRVLSYDPSGNLMASITRQGKVIVIPDRDGDGQADERVTLLENLIRPHGLAVRCTERCQLYVAEENKVSAFDYEYNEAKKLHYPVNGRKIIDLPAGTGHFTRTILFMPEPFDHKLLISVGSSCNVCQENDWRRAKILMANADGSDLKEYVRGLRNSVFMAIHPVSGKIWVTEMGRDHLGDNLPPDEINILEEGGWYGWPWFYGKNVEDLSWTNSIPGYAIEPIPSHIDIQAHSAPLGLAFIPEEGWPEDYRHDLIVAYHGSWNRSEPTGYKIVRMKLDAEGNFRGAEDFISGWLQPNGTVTGRPADVLIQPGGVMYISDDKAGVIYKVTRTGK